MRANPGKEIILSGDRRVQWAFLDGVFKTRPYPGAGWSFSNDFEDRDVCPSSLDNATYEPLTPTPVAPALTLEQAMTEVKRLTVERDNATDALRFAVQAADDQLELLRSEVKRLQAVAEKQADQHVALLQAQKFLDSDQLEFARSDRYALLDELKELKVERDAARKEAESEREFLLKCRETYGKNYSAYLANLDRVTKEHSDSLELAKLQRDELERVTQERETWLASAKTDLRDQQVEERERLRKTLDLMRLDLTAVKAERDEAAARAAHIAIEATRIAIEKDGLSTQLATLRTAAVRVLDSWDTDDDVNESHLALRKALDSIAQSDNPAGPKIGPPTWLFHRDPQDDPDSPPPTRNCCNGGGCSDRCYFDEDNLPVEPQRSETFGAESAQELDWYQKREGAVHDLLLAVEDERKRSGPLKRLERIYLAAKAVHDSERALSQPAADSYPADKVEALCSLLSLVSANIDLEYWVKIQSLMTAVRASRVSP
jgi:hypothetical protein